MPATKLTSREFNQDTGRAKKAADARPVFITDRGRTSHVLLSITYYEKLAHPGPSIVDLLAVDEEGAAIDFDPQPLQGPLSLPADFD